MDQPPITPYLTVADAKAAIAFYEKAFGATATGRMDTPDGSKVIHAALRFPNGGLVMLSDDFPEMMGGKRSDPRALGGTAVVVHLDVPDADATWARATEAGVTVLMPLADAFWGDRYGMVEDPFGHRWSIATRKKAVSEDDLRREAEKHFGAKG